MTREELMYIEVLAALAPLHTPPPGQQMTDATAAEVAKRAATITRAGLVELKALTTPATPEAPKG